MSNIFKFKSKLRILKKLSKLKLWQKITIAILLLAIIASGVVLIIGKSDYNKTVFELEASDDVTFSEPTIRITEDSKSDACNKFPREKIEAIIGSETDGAKISIPNTENAQGMVSGCTYSTKDNSKSQVRYISIVIRTFKDAKKADKSYLALAGVAEQDKPRDSRAVILEGSNQVVSQEGEFLTVITVAKSRSDAGGVENVLKELLKIS